MAAPSTMTFTLIRRGREQVTERIRSSPPLRPPPPRRPRADLIVEGKVLVELKSVEKISPAHKNQVLTYLQLTGVKLGYLLNFGEALMKDEITRTINGSLPP